MRFNTEFLSLEMKKRGLTDQDLAFEMLREGESTSASSVTLWRHGKSAPHLIKAAILAKIFNCPMDAFIDGIKN